MSHAYTLALDTKTTIAKCVLGLSPSLDSSSAILVSFWYYLRKEKEVTGNR
jgi:hypothetical protein